MATKNTPYRYPWGHLERKSIFELDPKLRRSDKTSATADENKQPDSETVTAAAPEKASAYTSKYLQSAEKLLDNAAKREPFSYDFKSDDLYKQYKKSYESMADKAARDAMGNAASLSGGYGNTYAQTASQQVQSDYLSKLSDKIPELYNIAYNRYKDENDFSLDRLYAALDLDEQEYSQYRDSVEQQNYENEQAYKRYKDALEQSLQSEQESNTQSGIKEKESEGTKSETKQPEGSEETQAGAADEERKKSIEKLSEMYKEYADYIYDDEDRKTVAQEIKALEYIGSLTQSEAQTLVTVLGLEKYV